MSGGGVAVERRVRRVTVTPHARLRSIASDAAWLQSALAASASCGALPVFTNLRTGAWYVPPAAAAGACCFKSTDGHLAGPLAFSRTRLNLPLAAAAGAAGGAVVVDATGGAKRFPDSFNTLAVWAAVLNGARGVPRAPPLADFFPRWAPRGLAADAERVAAAALAALPPALRDALRADLAHLGARPLVPLYVCQPSAAPGDAAGDADADWEEVVWPLLDDDAESDDAESGDAEGDDAETEGEEEGAAGADGAAGRGRDGAGGGRRAARAIPLVCVSVSRFVTDAGDEPSAHAGYRYVPGAGDDADVWAVPLGLTPARFWAHADALVGAADNDECVERAAAIARAAAAAAAAGAGARAHAAAAPAPLCARALRAAAAPLAGGAVAVAGPAALAAARAAAPAAADAPPPPPRTTIFFVAVMGGGGDAAAGAAIAGAVTLALPGDKRALTHARGAWDEALGHVVRAAGAGDALLVAFAEPRAASLAAGVAAAALLATRARGAPPLGKDDVRTALALACLPCAAPSVERSTLKTLHKFFLEGPTMGAPPRRA
jgi:hypothetical protein